MRIMLDTNVLLRAFLTPSGAAAELLKMIAADHLLVTSGYQLAELLDVLRRPKIRALHRRDDRAIRHIISRIYKMALVVPLPTQIPNAVPDDPKDNPIVLTATAGQADLLCTLDRHLHNPAVVDFCSRQGLRVLKDADLLAELRTA
jgi:putative PIN family toxin of toxin-antitoxin system